jgi:uncharacterized membrane protein
VHAVSRGRTAYSTLGRGLLSVTRVLEIRTCYFKDRLRIIRIPRSSIRTRKKIVAVFSVPLATLLGQIVQLLWPIHGAGYAILALMVYIVIGWVLYGYYERRETREEDHPVETRV